MIVNNKKPESKSARSVIENSEYEFYIGGSRYFAEAHPQLNMDVFNSDYDYYATYSGEIFNWLKKNGFEESNINGEYYDDEAVSVLSRDDVQVVLRQDAEFYRKCFESINPYVFMTYYWKQSLQCSSNLRKALFNQLFYLGHLNHEK